MPTRVHDVCFDSA